MIRADVIDLIQQTTHGVLDTPQETKRQVFCAVDSVNRTEYYRALQYDLHPEVVFILSDYAEYQGESMCEWNGIRYDIIRTYVNGLKVELTCERSKTQPIAPTPQPIYPVIIPEQTVTAAQDSEMDFYYAATLSGDIVPMIVGNVYRVTINGVAYELGALALEGDVVFICDDMTDEEWTFQIGQWHEDDNLVTMLLVKDGGEYTVKVELLREPQNVIMPLQRFSYPYLGENAELIALMHVTNHDICKVTFDGEEYELEARIFFYPPPALGDLDIDGDPSYVHYPFYAGVYSNSLIGFCQCADTGMHSLEVLLIEGADPV